MSGVDVETVPQCPHAPRLAETRRGVASIRYRTDFLDLQAFDFMGRFFVQLLNFCWTTLGQTATAREGHEVYSWFRACGALAANTSVLCNNLLQHGTPKSERSTVCKSCRFLR